MSRVAILTSHLTNGDAVSNDVIGMHTAFEKHGYEAKVFAGSADFTEPEVHPAAEIGEFLTDSADLLIYHYSIGWDPGLELLRKMKCRTSIKYHNVTPPEFFAGISPWHEEKCRMGREEMKEIAQAGCDIYLADSEFNRLDLLLEGADEQNSFVVPPFHHIERLQATDADFPILNAYRDGKTNILMVGRVAPHKGHAALIKAFAIYHHEYNPNSRLLIVGKEEEAFQIYSRRLRELTTFLALEDAVSFVGAASNSELKSYYLLSSAFAIASRHEGFCVPVVEAMSMKVPVVAYASSALPATVDGAGIILKEADPGLMAEAIDRLIRDESLNVAFGMLGWRRYTEHFTNDRIETELFQALNHSQPLQRV